MSGPWQRHLLEDVIAGLLAAAMMSLAIFGALAAIHLLFPSRHCTPATTPETPKQAAA